MPPIARSHTPLATSSSTTTQVANSTSPWRCERTERLHRDGRPCTDSPPSSPIIDTPQKRVRMQRRAAGLLLNSQSTQPTPSRAAALRLRPQARTSGGPPDPEGSVVSANPGQNNAFVNAHDSNEQGFFHLSPPSQQTSEQPVPETPVGLGRGLGMSSSPPLPQLTASNLSLLNGHAASQRSTASAANVAASALGRNNHNDVRGDHTPIPVMVTPASPVPSISSSTPAQIARLVLRTRINALKHSASEMQLAATQADLSFAHAKAQREAARSRKWQVTVVLLLLLCAAYVSWRCHRSAEFDFIEACQRAYLGL